MIAMWFIGLLQLSQVLAAPRCETFAPSGLELRDDGRLAGWSVEQLRGRRWSASVVSSGGGEELFDGYSAGRCVVGTWTKEEPLAQGSDVGLCLAKCQQDEGCLGILYGEVEGRQRPRTARCFLAGVGRNDVLMEYPGASSSTVTSEALMELAATLQCWQKLRQRCVVPPPEREKVDVEAPEPRQKESVESVAGLLSELRSRLKSLPALTSAARGVFRSVQPGHLLLILGGFCRLFGRAADNADLAVQRCLKAAQATLEGPTGTTAICIIIFPIFGLLGQRLRSWQQRLAKWQAAKAAEKVHFSDMVIPGFDVQTCSSHQSVPMLLSSGSILPSLFPKKVRSRLDVHMLQTIVECGEHLAEPALWVSSWRHQGQLQATLDARTVLVSTDQLFKVLQDYARAFADAILYARCFVKEMNNLSQISEEITDLPFKIRPRSSGGISGMGVRSGQVLPENRVVHTDEHFLP